MSYESPIAIIYGEIQTQIEDGMLKAVQDVGFNVNKIELQKALMYDRKQYTQGFEDGRKYEQEESVRVVRCRDCKWYDPLDPNRPVSCLYMEDVMGDDYCSRGERRYRNEINRCR